MVKITCNGETLDDCIKCNKAFSSTSLDWSARYGEKVSKQNCSIGGSRVFDESGELIALFN